MRADEISSTSRVFLATLTVYVVSVLALNHTSPSMAAYFDDLAGAFLQGRLHLIEPPSTYDLTLHDGRWYVPFPPLPALLLLPFVAMVGVSQANPLALSLMLGTANVALVWLILRRLPSAQGPSASRGVQAWLTTLFAIGSVHWQIATEGSVWFLAQTCAFTFVALSYAMTLGGARPWACGGALAIAMLGRPNLIFAWPFLLGVVIQQRGGLRAAAPWALKSLAPCALSVLALGACNQARFGDPLDFGYRDQNVHESLIRDLDEHGQFSLAFLPRNAQRMFLAGPRWNEAGWPVPDDRGMSVLLTTPALMLLLLARPRGALGLGAWAALLCTLTPLLLYYNTGWRQFGYRFSLDALPPALVLLFIGAQRVPPWALRGLVLAGVVVNAWGLIWWHRGWPPG